jgi:Flp pilus assembly protein CpaB
MKYSSRRRFIYRPAIVVTVIAVTLLGVSALLWGSGLLSAATFGFTKPPSTAGLVPVPVSAGTIPAYTKMTRDQLWNPATQNFAQIYLRPEQITPDMLTKVSDILGRVLDHDKKPGYVFTESDFLPRGTRAGLVAGIPAGKRAMRIDLAKVDGLFGLNPGDRFDLVATLPIDANRSGQTTFNSAGVYGQQLALQASMTNWMKQATVRVLVQNGVVVEPMATRNVPITQSTLTQGLVTRPKPLQEVVIAVQPDEVARLTEAIAVNAGIACVPRSGRPDDPLNSFTPDLQPWNPFSGLPPGGVATNVSGNLILPQGSSLNMVESIRGSNREMVTVPSKPRER